jgi:hypothetical protein
MLCSPVRLVVCAGRIVRQTIDFSAYPMDSGIVHKLVQHCHDG